MTEKEFLHQWELLGNRSSKILGGYVTEELFTDTFLSDDIPHTKSWWFSRTPDKRIFCFVEKRELSELDRVVYEKLQKNCFQLYIENGTWVARSLKNGQVWSLSEFVEQFDLKPIPKRSLKTGKAQEDSQHEKELLCRCIDYYRQKGMLADIQRSIEIEDLFLNRYFYTSNLDLLVGRKDGESLVPVCLEIKFKDPFIREGEAVYGIDRYQLAEEYSILERVGILTYAVILNNTCRDKLHTQSTNIFRYLELVEPKDREWLYARISKQVDYLEYKMASKKTGFAGVQEKPRTVLCIPKRSLHRLDRFQTLMDDKSLLDAAGNALPVCPRCAMLLKLRKGRFGEFWGCSSYPNCKFTKEN